MEEIGLIYTFVRTENGDRLVIPNEKLASDTIRNSTIRSREKVAEISLQVPLGQDLGAVVDRLRTIAGDGEVFVSDLSEIATVVVQAPARRSLLGRAARARAPPPCLRSAARRRRVRMTPPPRRGRSQPDTFLLDRLRKRRRKRVKSRRKRVGKLVCRRAHRHGALPGRVELHGRGSLDEQLRPRHAQSGRGRAELVRLRGRRISARVDSGGTEPPTGRARLRSAPGRPRRRSRSRTDASTSTVHSTGSGSCARSSRTFRREESCREGRRSPSSSCATSTSRRSRRRSDGRRPRHASRSSSRVEKSKTWILNAYMNQVYYGNHAYGIEAAAQTYFSKPARELTLNQSALLAGLPQAPSVFDPFQRPAQAIARRDEVLRAMLANGNITSSQYANAVAKRNLRLKAGRLVHAYPRAVLLQLRARGASAPVRREHGPVGRAEGLHDDRPASAEVRTRRDQAHVAVLERPCRGDRLDQPAQRGDSRDDRGESGESQEPGELRIVGTPPAGVDVQDDRV